MATISAHWSFVVQLPPQNLDQASFTTFLVSSQKASAPLCSSSWSKCLDPAENCHCQEIEISCLKSTFTCVSIDDHSSNCYQQETRQQLNIQHFVKVSEIISPIMITSAGFWDHFIFINCYLVTLSILALLLIHCKLYSCIHTLSVTRITTNCFKLTKTDYHVTLSLLYLAAAWGTKPVWTLFHRIHHHHIINAMKTLTDFLASGNNSRPRICSIRFWFCKNVFI